MNFRTTIIHSLLAVAFLMSFSVSAAPVNVDLTVGTWIISGSDISGTSWSGSTIKFESQAAQGDNLLLSGKFQWTGTGRNGGFGGEKFTGTLFVDSSMHLEGFELVSPRSNLVLGIYDAELTTTGNELINGRWGGPGIPSNSWSAVRVVPIPAAFLLFGSGIVGFFAVCGRRKSIN